MGFVQQCALIYSAEMFSELENEFKTCGCNDSFLYLGEHDLV